MKDPVLDSMASELRRMIVERGLDPSKPPSSKAPSSASFAEYQRRGGKLYTDPDDMNAALIERVKEVA